MSGVRGTGLLIRRAHDVQPSTRQTLDVRVDAGACGADIEQHLLATLNTRERKAKSAVEAVVEHQGRIGQRCRVPDRRTRARESRLKLAERHVVPTLLDALRHPSLEQIKAMVNRLRMYR